MGGKFHSLIRSRRFWLAVAGLAFVTAEHFGFQIDPHTVENVVLLAGAWIVGDSLRATV